MNKYIGVYKITNLYNKNVYIGSSNNIYKRKREHFSALKNSNHYNTHLQRAFLKYGEENFKFDIIELCAEEDLLKVEQKYIDLYYDNGIKCYNQNKIAGKPPSRKGAIPWNKGKKASKEFIEKCKVAHIGICHTEETKEKIRKLARSKEYITSKNVFCKEKNVIFKSINEASRELNISRQNISKCCNGKRKTAGGYHWNFI